MKLKGHWPKPKPLVQLSFGTVVLHLPDQSKRFRSLPSCAAAVHSPSSATSAASSSTLSTKVCLLLLIMNPAKLSLGQAGIVSPAQNEDGPDDAASILA